MASWSQRNSGYKVGVCLLVIASLLFLAGYAGPYWTKRKAYSMGLWLVCRPTGVYSNSPSTCDVIQLTKGWFRAVQTLQSLCLIGLVISLIYAAVVNCQSSLSRSPCLEILAGVSGILASIGAIIFAAEMKNYGMHYGWAFALDVLGCLLIMGSAVIIFISNRCIHTADPSTTTTAAQGQIYTPPPALQQRGAAQMQPMKTYTTAPSYAGPTYPPPQIQPVQTHPAAPPHSYQPMGVPSQYPQYPYPPTPGTFWEPPPPGGMPPPGYVLYAYPQGSGGGPSMPYGYAGYSAGQNVPQDRPEEAETKMTY